ncbi:MAG: hypothetical protein ACK5MN_08130 [Lachnospiraceae bacterium]
MVNEDKVRLMTKLARYEATDGKRTLPIAKYFLSDYIGLALIKNFFLITFAYGIILFMVIGYYYDFLLDNIHKMNVVTLGAQILIGYICILAIYSVITYARYLMRYRNAHQSLKKYYAILDKVNRTYVDEPKKSKRKHR